MKKIIFILITGLIVWITIQFPKTMVNPGDLTTGHQNLSDNCYSCHKPFWGISNENCIKCHTLSEIGKDTVAKLIMEWCNDSFSILKTQSYS